MSNFISTSVEATKELGYKFASKLKRGDVIVLNGDLGSGKTIFVSGFLSFYGKENEASSPTFTIVNEHNLTKDLNLYHFDVYRLESSDEFLAIGGDEYFSQGITLMEWGEKIQELLPKHYLEINIFKDDKDINLRNFVFTPKGERYESLVKEVLE
ncbi:MAG: tRNA (adenosine(37)-N6)-threonylcarbamoyltransferase complex ATPase subunit type 1 TsaE [Clostridia bacterium]|nr:tRNA (adenosine(37)-N6)-threonylcarbamoyltransferase complex ATPase subunit type 1 TsaE [Clostridia bacterium]